MSEEPDTHGPTQPPEIPRKPLWIALSIPPFATLVGNLIVGIDGNTGDYGTEFLWVPIVVFFIIIFSFPAYYEAIKIRYQGRSLVFLNLAYFFGQIIVCLSLWLGSCMLFAK